MLQSNQLKRTCLLLTEFVPGGDLKSLIEKNPDGLGESTAKFYLAELCLALKTLHDVSKHNFAAITT